MMKIKTVSFNIRYCDDRGGNSIRERAPRLFDVISRYAPDVIGLQEYRPAWERYIEKYFAIEYAMFNKYRTSEVELEASPILWRRELFDCIDTGYFWLSDTPDVESRGWDEIGCYRMCVYVTLREKKSGTVFTSMNTHFGFGDGCQMKSARLIAEQRSRLPQYPTFVLGDFNMSPDSEGYKEMTKYFTDANAATSRDMRDTYHGYHPEKHKNEHIDYCFTDSAVAPLYQKIMDEKADGGFPSDHYGIYTEIEI